MAHQNKDGTYSLPAAADLSSSQYCGVVLNSSGQFALPSLGGDIDGVLDNFPVSGAQARVDLMDGMVLKVRYGGTVAIGDNLSVLANGKFVTSVTSTHKTVGKCLVAGVTGDIGTMLFRRGLPAVT